MKELPMMQYMEQYDSWPFLGLMQSEGGRRVYSLRQHGCNYVGKDTKRSCPFNFFTHSDVLRLALEMNIHVPEIYGQIIQDADGEYHTTGARRTGCVCCGFGIHLDKRPHKFDRLYERNPKEWHYWMYNMGWGEVLDYIGVEWRQEGRQINLFGQIDSMIAQAQRNEEKV